ATGRSEDIARLADDEVSRRRAYTPTGHPAVRTLDAEHDPLVDRPAERPVDDQLSRRRRDGGGHDAVVEVRRREVEPGRPLLAAVPTQLGQDVLRADRQVARPLVALDLEVPSRRLARRFTSLTEDGRPGRDAEGEADRGDE